MSDASGMTDERAALMLELLGTIVQRFDGVENAMVALSKLQKQTAAKAPVVRNVEAETEALEKMVIRAAANGAAAGIDTRKTALSETLSTKIQNALLGDRQDARRLGEAAENMLHTIRKWAIWALLGTALTGVLIGALLVTWISLVDDAERFERDIGNSLLAELTCKVAGGRIAENDNGRFCYFQMPD